MFQIIFVLFVSFAFLSPAVGQTVSEDKAIEILNKLTPPITVTFADVYKDGGSIRISLIDSEGKDLSLGHPAPIVMISREQFVEKKIPKRIFPVWVSSKFSEVSRSELKPGGMAEAKILEILDSWFKDPRYKLGEISKYSSQEFEEKITKEVIKNFLSFVKQQRDGLGKEPTASKP
ncbi:MAG: hypothetical protein HQL24_04985 [Candidatus Omnitrophica bacterium]|nr:hypothetical protein [Candidatus Omnitrophota bacterium]